MIPFTNSGFGMEGVRSSCKIIRDKLPSFPHWTLHITLISVLAITNYLPLLLRHYILPSSPASTLRITLIFLFDILKLVLVEQVCKTCTLYFYHLVILGVCCSFLFELRKVPVKYFYLFPRSVYLLHTRSSFIH